jgi:hypothetical protein
MEPEITPEYAEYLRELPEIIANMIPTAQILAMGIGCPDLARYAGEDWSHECTPNPETAAVLRDADAGIGLTRYPSVEAMFEDLED